MPAKQVNPDLLKERKTATFDAREFSVLWAGGEERFKEKKALGELMKNTALQALLVTPTITHINRSPRALPKFGAIAFPNSPYKKLCQKHDLAIKLGLNSLIQFFRFPLSKTSYVSSSSSNRPFYILFRTKLKDYIFIIYQPLCFDTIPKQTFYVLFSPSIRHPIHC